MRIESSITITVSTARPPLPSSAASSQGAFPPGCGIRLHGHGPQGVAALRADSLFDGDENAIVDFKYSTDPRLTWWFDHHQSAFLTPEDAEHFRRDTSGRKLYDPSFKSCTLFICDGGRANASASTRRTWTNWCTGPISSTARSTRTPRTAVELGAPAMKLTLVIEAAKGSDIVQKIIGWMQHRRSRRDRRRAGDPGAVRAALSSGICDSIDMIRSRAQSGRRRGVLRSDRVRPGRLQQVHSVLPVSRFHLHGVGEPVQFPHQDFGGIESVGAGASRSTTWRPSASATAAAATRGWARSASSPASWRQARKVAAEIVAELKE